MEISNNDSLGNKIQIFTDGGARGNPGPAACAYTASTMPNGITISEDSEYINETTNNVAEYCGLLLGLNWLVKQEEMKIVSVNFYSDSQLAVNQIKGLYKVKDPNLRILYLKLTNLVKEIKQNNSIDIIFNYVPRSENKRADFLVNRTLDNIGKK